MPSIQSLVWRGIKPVVKPWVISRFRSGKLPSISWNRWKHISRDFWCSLDNHLIMPGEEVAKEELKTNHLLKEIITKEDLENTWAASPATILFIWQQLEVHQPKTIAEMGSGVSTRLFAFFAQHQAKAGKPVPRILSFDHDAHWLELTKKNLGERSLLKYVNLVHAPLGPMPWRAQRIQCYSIPQSVLDKIGTTIDFCMIDGPPKDIGREGTLPLLSRHFANSSQIYLDDARRPGEIDAVNQWIHQYARNISNVNGRPTIRGMIDIKWLR